MAIWAFNIPMGGVRETSCLMMDGRVFGRRLLILCLYLYLGIYLFTARFVLVYSTLFGHFQYTYLSVIFSWLFDQLGLLSAYRCMRRVLSLARERQLIISLIWVLYSV